MVQSDSITGFDRVAELARRHRVALLVVVLVLSSVCFQVVPDDTLAGSLAQAAVLAALALGAVGVSRPRALRAPRLGAGELGAWSAYVLVVGLAAGAAALFLLPQGVVLRVTPLSIAQVVALCLLTGVFEEGVFRVLAMEAFVPALGGGCRGVLRAALASAVLFGLLHVSAGDVIAASNGVAWAQALLKPAQAGLFGFFMAALYVRTHNLWAIAGVHALFNLLYTGPLMVAGGLQLTYVTGSPLDLVLLALSTALLVPAAIAAVAELRKAA